jgi:hypothetical protein
LRPRRTGREAEICIGNRGEFSDPLTTLPQIFLQDAYTPENHGTEAQSNRVIAQAIVPRVPSSTLPDSSS